MKSQYEYRVQYEQQYSQQDEPKLKTPEDGHRYAMFVKGNTYNKNGRTYIFKDHLGQHVSTFVSQYSPIIEKNLEPGVKDAVLKLHEKGYLTFTSCQGHDDSKHRYIGIVFNTKEQKHKFMHQMRKLKCDIYWYDNVINTVERPCTPVPWYSDAITIHIVYNDNSFANATVAERRDKPYTDEELTKFWNIQMCRNYDHYEAIVFTFGYPMVEQGLWQKIKKLFFYNHYKVTSAYYDFCNKVHLLEEYEA
jgi:hypothetical protein